MRKSIFNPTYLFIFLVIVGQSVWAGVAEQRRAIAPQYDRLHAIAREKGKVRVIINHKANNGRGPLSMLQRLKGSRDRLRNLMQQRNIQPLKEFRNFSGAVYSLTSSELNDLIDSGEADQVFEDKLNWPSLIQSRALIGADLSHNYGLKGNGAIVAILDTGIEGTHSAFSGRMVTEACFSSNYSPLNSTDLCPTNNQSWRQSVVEKGPGTAALDKCTDVSCSHGTHVASIATGSDGTITGIAPEAGIIAIQVFSRFSQESECGVGKAPCIASFDSDVRSALEYVADLVDGTVNNYNIAAVNMSFSGPTYATACNSSLYTTALNTLNNLGVAPVAASGNNSKTDRISTPACISSVVSVGYVDDVTDVVMSKSNASATLLDILAPGQNIRAAVPGGYGNSSGTSMAAPHVAGAMAILKATNSNYTVAQMLSILTTNSTAVVDTRSTPNQVYPRLDLGLVTHFLAGPAEVPQLTITSPVNNAVINSDLGAIDLIAAANDPQDGDISTSVTWMSDVDGVISSPATLTLGTHTLTATVTDSTGFSDSDSVTVTVANAPSVTITSPVNNDQLLEGSSLLLDGTANDIEDGDLSASIQWSSNLDGSLGVGVPINVNLSAGLHTITATATDSDGASPTVPPTVQVTIIADSDGDGMADSWELLYGVDDPAGDADNDGLTNLYEYQNGLNPVDAAPTVIITTPADGAEYVETSSIQLTGVGADNEDGDLSASISWSSDRDGFLGVGSGINTTLTLGEHIITATVTDSQGAEVVVPATVLIDIGIVGDINNDGLVNFTDLLLIESIMVGAGGYSEGSVIRADVYPEVGGDGSIGVADWLILQKRILGNN